MRRLFFCWAGSTNESPATALCDNRRQWRRNIDICRQKWSKKFINGSLNQLHPLGWDVSTRLVSDGKKSRANLNRVCVCVCVCRCVNVCTQTVRECWCWTFFVEKKVRCGDLRFVGRFFFLRKKNGRSPKWLQVPAGEIFTYLSGFSCYLTSFSMYFFNPQIYLFHFFLSLLFEPFDFFSRKGKVPSFSAPFRILFSPPPLTQDERLGQLLIFFTNKSFLGILFSWALLNEKNRDGQQDDRMSKQSEPFSCNVGVPIFQYYDDGDCIDCFHCNRQSYFFLGPFVFLSCILLFPFLSFRRENEAKG